ncbi:DNA-binding transcriptional regulator, MarR family [Pelosinus propionicus DSM 13327]|uniref:DNA-binding transcriptional regulator, MarR family n=2 Tax=Pelosinus TaxID=365348 RepID=A0A1I4PM27_9FIRM|nr:DNA-binding transcriptional regulator, MarR family [Pelosinus propionicus DSM 13327]
MIAKENLKTPSVCNCTNMRRASRALTQFYDKSLESSGGLKITQYSLLNHLKRLGPLTMNELSQAIRLERTTLVRNLKPLEKMGLVGMTAEENSHARRVHITESGQAILAAAAPYWAQAQQAVDELFTPEELDVFKKALQKIESLRF